MVTVELEETRAVRSLKLQTKYYQVENLPAHAFCFTLGKG